MLRHAASFAALVLLLGPGLMSTQVLGATWVLGAIMHGNRLSLTRREGLLFCFSARSAFLRICFPASRAISAAWQGS